MWQIFESKSAQKNIDRFPKHIVEKYEFWRSVVQVSGAVGLRKFPGFRDHHLKGNWAGHRSSCLNDAFRVIYRVDHDVITVFVVDVSHHDYRRK